MVSGVLETENGSDILVPVEVPPPGARVLPNIEVVEGGFWEKFRPLGCEDPPKVKEPPNDVFGWVGWLSPPKLMVGAPPN